MVIAFPLDFLVYNYVFGIPSVIPPAIIGFLFTLTIYYFRDKILEQDDVLPLYFGKHTFQILSSAILFSFLLLNYFTSQLPIVSVYTARNIVFFIVSYFLGVFLSRISENKLKRKVQTSTEKELRKQTEEVEKKFHEEEKEKHREYMRVHRAKRKAQKQKGTLEPVILLTKERRIVESKRRVREDKRA